MVACALEQGLGQTDRVNWIGVHGLGSYRPPMNSCEITDTGIFEYYTIYDNIIHTINLASTIQSLAHHTNVHHSTTIIYMYEVNRTHGGSGLK